MYPLSAIRLRPALGRPRNCIIFANSWPKSLAPALRPVAVLDQPARGDLYGDHWSLSGRQVPGARTADDAVFLPGRNVLLLSKALLWCHLNRVHALALAPLESNPFPDATPAFLTAMAGVVNQAVGGSVAIRLPYRGLHKTEVLHRGRQLQLPLAWTFSCLRPLKLRPCGACNKCAERRQVFRAVGLADPTPYCHPESPCSA